MSATSPRLGLSNWIAPDRIVPMLVIAAFAVQIIFSFAWMDGTSFGAALSNGLSLSAILILTGLGLAITFGVMRVINMAHGDLMMLGAYTAFEVTRADGLNLNLIWAIGFSFLIVGFIGYLLEICLIRFLYGRPLDTLLATWGVGILLQQAVLFKYRADLPSMSLPEILQGGMGDRNLTITVNSIFGIGIAAVCIFVVYLLVYKTSFSLKIRALMQKFVAALGISTDWVGSLTFAFASGMAGVAGCIAAYLFMTIAEIVQGEMDDLIVSMPVNRVFIVGITAVCIFVVYLWFYKTSFGLKIRAQVEKMAAALGISTRWVDSLTFAFASGMAGVAGCIAVYLSMTIAEILPVYRIFVVGITAVCIFVVYLWFYQTSFGLKIRAVVQNRPMAAALGISTRWVDSLTFAFASGLAGVAGCIAAYLYRVESNMGSGYVVESFIVVTLGGMGYTFASVPGGIVVGTESGFLAKILGNEELAKVLVYLLVVLFIMVRPTGLFAPKERSYD